MAVQMADLVRSALPDLRLHPVHKWVRAAVGSTVVVDTRRAMLVWEPRRVVPSYAVPTDAISGELVPSTGPADADERPVRLSRDGPPVLDPSTPFAVHSCPGTSWTIRWANGDLPGAAFSPEDPALAGYVVLDWSAFDQWYEEDQPVTAHPHDPFDRIDCLPSSRHVVVSAGGQVLADTTRPTLLFETPLPVRYYIPRADVRMDLLTREDRHSECAYKGDAAYWSASVDGTTLPGVAWSYERPLHDALPVQDLICFFTERLDLEVDGVPVERPITPWS